MKTITTALALLAIAACSSIQAAPTIAVASNRGASDDDFSPPGSITVLGSSTVAVGDILNIFGAIGGPEGDTTIFADSAIGTTYFVNFQVPSAIQLAFYRVILSDDSPSSNRGVSRVKLYSSADSTFNTLTLLSDVSLSNPYGTNYGGSNISVSEQISSASTQYFRLEFVNASFSGPRIVELDALLDHCPNSDIRPTVQIDTCESDVTNYMLDDGCTVQDLINEIVAGGIGAKSFKKDVNGLIKGLQKQGILTKAENRAIKACAKEASANAVP